MPHGTGSSTSPNYNGMHLPRQTALKSSSSSSQRSSQRASLSPTATTTDTAAPTPPPHSFFLRPLNPPGAAAAIAGAHDQVLHDHHHHNNIPAYYGMNIPSSMRALDDRDAEDADEHMLARRLLKYHGKQRERDDLFTRGGPSMSHFDLLLASLSHSLLRCCRRRRRRHPLSPILGIIP